MAGSRLRNRANRCGDPAELLQRFADGDSTMIPGARIAIFDLWGAAPNREERKLPDLTWADDPHAHSNSNACRRHIKTRLASNRRRGDHLSVRLSDSNAFSLRVQCARDDSTRTGQHGLFRTPPIPVTAI